MAREVGLLPGEVGRGGRVGVTWQVATQTNYCCWTLPSNEAATNAPCLHCRRLALIAFTLSLLFLSGSRNRHHMGSDPVATPHFLPLEHLLWVSSRHTSLFMGFHNKVCICTGVTHGGVNLISTVRLPTGRTWLKSDA